MTAARSGWAAGGLFRPARAGARAPGDLPPWLAAASIAAALLGGVLWFAAPFRATLDGQPDLAVYADDFFYYLVIAERALAGQGFTFDGTTPTNGFHPLWMAVLLALGSLAAPRGAAFFPLLHVVLLVATLATALGSYRMLRATLGYAGIPALVASTLVALQAAVLARNGMETTLALPLIFGAVGAIGRFADRPTPGRGAMAAMLGALAILARLDAAILFAMLTVAVLRAARRRGALQAMLAPRILAAIAAGLLPLIGYLALNTVVYGAPMPISGQAKQLAGLVINPIAFVWFAWTLQQLALLRLLNLVFVLTAIPLLALVAMLGFGRRRPVIPDGAPTGLARALLAFPLVYFTIIGLISDWGLWLWYMYPVVPATAVAAAGAAHAALARGGNRAQRWSTAVAVVFGVAGLAIVAAEAPRRPWQGRAIVEASLTLAAFADDHPGRYAMGDRAGAFAWLTRRPVLQLEGLVADPTLIADIRAQRPLLEALSARGIDYYVASRLERAGDCWRAEEPHPHQAGERSPRMASTICADPVLTVRASDRVDSLVFDLRSAPPAPRAAPAALR